MSVFEISIEVEGSKAGFLKLTYIPKIGESLRVAIRGKGTMSLVVTDVFHEITCDEQGNQIGKHGLVSIHCRYR